MKFLRLSELPLAGKRVFIRADLNVPQDDAGNITEDTRIRATIPGIKHALRDCDRQCLKAGIYKT